MIEIETKGREERGGKAREGEEGEEGDGRDYGETRESKKSERYIPPIQLILITNGT